MPVSPEVVSFRFPYLPLALQVGELSLEVESLLDSGFDGGIAVPMGLLENAGNPDGRAMWTPVAGAPVAAPVYRGLFTVGDLGAFRVTITAIGDEILAGQEFMAYFTVTLDHGRRVTITR